MEGVIIALAVVANAVAGARWRRWLGSNHPGRWLVLPVGALLTWPLWVAFPWPIAAPLAFGCVAFFVPGHETADNRVWRRYGPFGAGYWLAHRYLNERAWAARGYPTEGFIDGWMSLGELFLGGTFWGAVALVLLFR